MATQPNHSAWSNAEAERREGLTLERFAEVLAYRKFFPAWHGEGVLLRLGIRPARWARAAAAWGQVLESAVVLENPDVVLRFARAFGLMSKKLREYPPRLESLGDPIDPNTPDPEERLVPVPERRSFMNLDTAPALPIQPPGPNAGSVWTQYARSAVTVPAPPMPAPEPAPAPAPVPGPPPLPRRRALETTADISEFVPRNPSPFTPVPGRGGHDSGSK